MMEVFDRRIGRDLGEAEATGPIEHVC